MQQAQSLAIETKISHPNAGGYNDKGKALPSLCRLLYSKKH